MLKWECWQLACHTVIGCYMSLQKASLAVRKRPGTLRCQTDKMHLSVKKHSTTVTICEQNLCTLAGMFLVRLAEENTSFALAVFNVCRGSQQARLLYDASSSFRHLFCWWYTWCMPAILQLSPATYQDHLVPVRYLMIQVE